MNSFSKAVFLGLAVGLLQPAIADDTLKGGYKNSSSDFPRHVVSSASSPPLAGVENSHHNDGDQDRSGRDWTAKITPHGDEHSFSAIQSNRWGGWNSK
ncbi:MAG: hypothetical protein P9E24_11340 [Candidatus Competibacter sp.]|nr:hypothetical protein [Candidatus Competibacter sp.]MDG4583800.1 hypothetical protein [Candidatus Competibacter sp.]